MVFLFIFTEVIYGQACEQKQVAQNDTGLSAGISKGPYELTETEKENQAQTYLNFLRSKKIIAPESGFEVDRGELSEILKPHQKDAVQWALKGGRRAVFAKFGMGKTVIQLEYCRQVIRHEGGKALMTVPLGVKQEFIRDAVNLLGMNPPVYVRNMAEARAAESDILITNYERIRDGDIDPSEFSACSLDEAAVLRSFGSKTYQEFLLKFRGVKYKICCTATPDPNKYKELIHYAGFLEIMDTGQALTRFFQRDSTKANNLTLYPHKEEEFWLWVTSWALFIGKPSDVCRDYSDAGYDLPPLKINYHRLEYDNAKRQAAQTDREIDEVQRLTKAYNARLEIYQKTGDGAERLAEIAQELNAISPIEIEFIDEKTGKYKELGEQIDNVVEAMVRERDVNHAKNTWNAEMDALDEAQRVYAEATKAKMDYRNDAISIFYDETKEWNDLVQAQADAYAALQEQHKKVRAAEKDLEQAYGGSGIPDITKSVEYTVETNAQAYEDAATRDAKNYRASIIKADNAKKAEYNKFKNEYAKLKYTYDTADIQDDKWFYGELERLLREHGDESIEEYQTYYVQLAGYKRKQRENDTSAEKSASAERLAITKQSAAEQLAVIQENMSKTKSLYESNYNDLLNQRKAYEDKLSSLSKIYQESTQKDENGESKDVFELLNLEEGNRAIEQFDDKLAALEDRKIGQNLSNYILSLSSEQGEKMITALSEMNDEELSAYVAAYDKRTKLIKERAEKRYAPMFADLNTAYLAQMSTIFEGVSDEAKDFGASTVDGFIEGFGGNSDAAVAAVSAWADGIIKTMQDKLNSGVASLDEQIIQTLAKTDISMGGTAQISADIVPGNINVPTNAEIKQSVTEQVTVKPDMSELNEFYDKFAEKISELKIDIGDMAIDVSVKGVITDAVQNKIVDLIADKIGIRSMMSGKEAWSY